MTMLTRATRRSNCCSRARRAERLISCALGSGSEGGSATGGRDIARAGRTGEGRMMEPCEEMGDVKELVEGGRFEDLGL